jgi:hypothetical protein
VQRIEVTEDVITLTTVTEPRFSVFGNEVQPGHTSVFHTPWEDVFRIGLMTVRWHPERDPQTCLVIDLTYGEFFEVTDDADGFDTAVRELCRQVGVPVPDYAPLRADWVDIL